MIAGGTRDSVVAGSRVERGRATHRGRTEVVGALVGVVAAGVVWRKLADTGHAGVDRAIDPVVARGDVHAGMSNHVAGIHGTAALVIA